MSRKLNKPRAYAWVAYMITHEPEEMARVRKHKTPSDRLITLAETPRIITNSSGKLQKITFPESLNARAGQKALTETLERVDQYLKTIPMQAYDLLSQIKTTLRVRRADTKSNILMVAEALLHRASSEFKHEVLFAFDSINTWIKAVYDKELGYLTLRKALELLQEQGFIRVNEWGKRGNRAKCTKVEFIPTPRKEILTYTSDLDDWLLFNDHGMMAVYRRESTTRQDVLEARFHHYADEMAAMLVEESRWAQGARLFPSDSGKIAVVEPVKAQVIEKELFNETYIDRLLGGLVPSLQEDESFAGQASSGIRERNRSG